MVVWPDELVINKAQMRAWVDALWHGGAEAHDAAIAEMDKISACNHHWSWTDMTGEYVCTKCHTPKGTRE